MNRQKFVFTIGLFLILGFGCLLIFKRENQPEKIPITLGDFGRPYVELNIQGTKRSVLFNTGAKIPLTLLSSTVDTVEKKEKGEFSWTNMNGEKFQAPKFLVKNLKLGAKKIREFEFCVDEDECETIGRPILEKANILFDYPRKSLWLIKSKSQLKAIGFDLKKLNKVPFTVSNSGILFPIETDRGSFIFSISTADTISYINADLFDSEVQDSVDLEFLRIGTKNYGKKALYTMSFPEGLNSDGSLGLDFLKEHIVYIDYKNKFLYFGNRWTNSVFGKTRQEFNVGSQRSIPFIRTTINGEESDICIDTGSVVEMELRQGIYETISNETLHEQTLVNFRGNRYTGLQKNVPEIQIGEMKFKNLVAFPVNEEFHQSTNSDGEKLDPKIKGVIGKNFLEKVNMYFDFPNSKLVLTNEKEKPPSQNPIPFSLGKDLLILKVETDLGPLRLLLDTGSSHNVLRSSSIESIEESPNFIETETFKIGEYDYGPQRLKHFYLSEEFDRIDGILGMEFMHTRKLYIDYPNQVLYISE